MADVFVSYASEDRDRVRPLVDVIEGAGFSVWWDPRIDLGTSFDREIEHELELAECVVVVWSGRSIESDWVRAEAQEGLDRGILVPVLIDDVKPPLAFSCWPQVLWSSTMFASVTFISLPARSTRDFWISPSWRRYRKRNGRFWPNFAVIRECLLAESRHFVRVHQSGEFRRNSNVWII